jgi:hemoglobin
MNDIETRKDIQALMVDFYDLAFADDMIGYIFTDVAKMDLDEHLPVIVDFWESMILGTGSYQARGRNPMLIHHQLAEKTPLLPEHFERWLELFESSVNKLFIGERAELIKHRASSIAERMVANICRVHEIDANRQTGEAVLRRQ